MRIPDGWEYVSDYCISCDGWTICRIGDAYELWRGKEQLLVNLPSAQVAIDERLRLLSVPREASEAA